MRRTSQYMALPYNPALRERARELRKAGMLHEVLLWNRLKRRQFEGLDFDRQKIIGNYIVDFFCAELGVVIEADGTSHRGREEYDARRDEFLRGLGLRVFRVPVENILDDVERVVGYLRRELVGEMGPSRPPATPPREGKGPPRPSGTPPQEGNLGRLGMSAGDGDSKGNGFVGEFHSPPAEGWPPQADGVVGDSPPVEGWPLKADGVVEC